MTWKPQEQMLSLRLLFEKSLQCGPHYWATGSPTSTSRAARAIHSSLVHVSRAQKSLSILCVTEIQVIPKLISALSCSVLLVEKRYIHSMKE